MTEDKKFVVGEDLLPPSPPSIHSGSNVSHHTKKHAKHHVKRRSSSGRVHVAKLTSMSRSNAHTDSEAETEVERPILRRSQSQRSLQRFERKKKLTISMIPSAPTHLNKTGTVSPPATPLLSALPKRSPCTHLSNSNLAAPVEQTFNAIANNLVVPTQSAFPAMHDAAMSTPSQDSLVPIRKQPLRSQFINLGEDTHEALQHNIPRTTWNPGSTHQPSGKEYDGDHSNCVFQLMNELDSLDREYRQIKQYQGPLRESLQRCTTKLQKRRQSSTSRIATTSLPLSRPTTTRLARSAPHVDQRQAAYRHRRLKAFATDRTHNISSSQFQSTSQQGTSSDSSSSLSVNIMTFFDRVLNISR